MTLGPIPTSPSYGPQTAPRLRAAWRASLTARWHKNADMCHIYDPNCGHSGRVALLAILLFPTAHAVHRAAILHDIGEASVADVAGDVKDANPVLRAELDRLEADAIADLGIKFPQLEDIERRMLWLCDKLDAWMWVGHHKPHLLQQLDWREARSRILTEANRLRVNVTEVVG